MTVVGRAEELRRKKELQGITEELPIDEPHSPVNLQTYPDKIASKLIVVFLSSI